MEVNFVLFTFLPFYQIEIFNLVSINTDLQHIHCDQVTEIAPAGDINMHLSFQLFNVNSKKFESDIENYYVHIVHRSVHNPVSFLFIHITIPVLLILEIKKQVQQFHS